MISRVECFVISKTHGGVLAVLESDKRFTPDGFRMGFRPEHLEPYNPDPDPSTWEEVQKLTNWNPTKVTA